MRLWNAAQLGAFLRWSEQHSTHYALWYLLAYTGMRRGEALAMCWRDVKTWTPGQSACGGRSVSSASRVKASHQAGRHEDR